MRHSPINTLLFVSLLKPSIVHWRRRKAPHLNISLFTSTVAFTLTEMLCDVNHWLMDIHGVISDTPAHGAHLMLVIGESHSLHHSTTFFLLFSPSFSSTLFCLCFPCLLRLAHPFWVILLHFGHSERIWDKIIERR